MALAHAFYRVNVNFMETSGKTVNRLYKLNPATVTTDAGAASAATDLVADLAPLTDAVISGYQIENVFLDSAAEPPAAAENSNQALITAKLTGKPNQSGDISIPAAADAIFVSPTGAGHDIVNVTQEDVDAFLTNLAPGGTVVISDGDTIVLATASGKRRNVHSIGS